MNIAILYGSFHSEEMKVMVEEARVASQELGLQVTKEVAVPGSMEKPLAAQRLLTDQNVSGLVVLGIIERGETGHGRTMANAVIRSLVDIQLQTNKPMGVGILGPEILPDQIGPRLKPYSRSAVKALRHMLVNEF